MVLFFPSVLFFFLDCPAFLDATVFVYPNNAVRRRPIQF
jgi:hypothetical protein